MTTSGTYTFDMSNADILLEAFDRCQIRPAALTNEHMISARRSINLELANFSNRGVNLWAVDLQEVAMTEGTTSYTLDANTVQILDVYISTTAGGTTTDRILSPLGRTDYAMIPNKEQQGTPTSYWFDRQITPVLYVWQAAAEDNLWTLKYYRMRRIQDAAATMGQTADIPFRFLDALCASLAARLARKYAPALVGELKAEATEMMALAMLEDRERAPIYITPDLSGYQV